jgi:hypothetical protein
MSETSIPLDKATRDRVRLHGQKGETYVQILNRILDERTKKMTSFEDAQIDEILKQLENVIVENNLYLDTINVNLDSVPHYGSPFFISDLIFEVRTKVMRKPVKAKEFRT